MASVVKEAFSKEDLSIQRLTTSDASRLSLVARKAYADHYLDLWYDQGSWYMDTYFSAQKLAAELADPNAQFYLALYCGVPVGFLKLNINAALEGFENRKALELERIYLNQDASGRG